MCPHSSTSNEKDSKSNYGQEGHSFKAKQMFFSLISKLYCFPILGSSAMKSVDYLSFETLVILATKVDFQKTRGQHTGY